MPSLTGRLFCLRATFLRAGAVPSPSSPRQRGGGRGKQAGQIRSVLLRQALDEGKSQGRKPWVFLFEVLGPGALESLLLMTGLDGSQIPEKLDGHVALWRDRVAGMRFILVLDDAVSSDQVRPILPSSERSLVLITSREQLSGLVEARAVRLEELTPDQTAELIVSIADRPGLRTDDSAVADIARMCARLPLAAGIMGGQLRDHTNWTPGELAAEMTSARGGLELMEAENLSVATAFQLSYRDLPVERARLFRRLSLHPGADFDAWAAAALDGGGLDATGRNLAALRAHHMLAEPTRGRYRFHDLIREYARSLAEEEPAADHGAATDRLLDYYVHTARSADRYLARRTPTAWPAPAVAAPRYAPDLPGRDPCGRLDDGGARQPAGRRRIRDRSRPARARRRDRRGDDGLPAAVRLLGSGGHVPARARRRPPAQGSAGGGGRPH